MAVVAQVNQQNQVSSPGKLSQVDDLEVLAKRKQDRDRETEMNKIREEISYTSVHNQTLFEANKYSLVESLPEEIGGLSKVKKINVTNNYRLYKLPESIGDLYERLETLNLSYNNLQEFPLSLCRLKYLQRLDLNNNKIKSLPTKVDQLKNLEVWTMDSNYLMALPYTITQLKNCSRFHIENNPLCREDEGEFHDPPVDPTINVCSVTGEKLGSQIFSFVNFTDFGGNKRIPIHYVCCSEEARDVAIEEKDKEPEDFWTLKY